MPEGRLSSKQVIQLIKTLGLQEPLDFDPENPEQFFISNIITRVFAHLFGWDGKKTTRIKTSRKGLLETLRIPSPTDQGTYANKTVTTSATKIISANANRMRLLIVNKSPQVIFIGLDNSVTIANGIPLAELSGCVLDDWNGDVWGIVAASTGDARYIELGTPVEFQGDIPGDVIP